MSQIIRFSGVYHNPDSDVNDNDFITTVEDDVLVIPVTHLYVAKETGGDAEALTLANGKPGQILVINLTTDGGGTGTLTPATCTGFSTIAFDEAFDQATLLYVDDTVGWIILGLFGTGSTPVVA